MGAQIPDGERSLPTSNMGKFTFYLQRGETFAVIPWFSPAMATPARDESGFTMLPTVDQDAGLYNTGTNATSMRAGHYYPPLEPATLKGKIFDVTESGQTKEVTTLSTNVSTWATGTELGYNMINHPLNLTGQSWTDGAVGVTATAGVGSHPGYPRSPAFPESADGASTWFPSKYGTRGNDLAIDFYHDGADRLANNNHVVKGKVMLSPYIIVAVLSVGMEVGSNGEVVVGGGTNKPAPAMAPKNVYESFVIDNGYRHNVTRHYVPMLGGIFDVADYLNRAMQYRMVGANLRVRVEGKTPQNLAFSSTSISDPSYSFFPPMGASYSTPLGWDTKFTQMANTRPGSRMSTGGAVAIYHTAEPEPSRLWKDECLMMSHDRADTGKNGHHSTSPLAIGTIGPLSSSVAQSPVLISVIGAAHFETQSKNLYMVSTPSANAVPTQESVESVLVAPHQTPTPTISSKPDGFLGKMLKDSSKLANDAATTHLLPKVLSKLEAGFEAVASRAISLL